MIHADRTRASRPACRKEKSGKRKKTPAAARQGAVTARTVDADIIPVRVNPWVRAYYQRLRAVGKPAKVALLAAMRKLLTAVYNIARHRRPFTLAPIFPLIVGGAVTPGVSQS